MGGGCNQSFTSNTEAIGHDSDPKLLRFKQQSQNPADLNGEGVIVGDLGTAVDLVNANPIGGSLPPVPGPTIGDLTGGTGGGGSPIGIGLKHLNGGRLSITVRADGSEAGVSVNVDGSFLAAQAIATGFGDINSAALELSSLVPPGDLAAILGLGHFGSEINAVYNNTITFTVDNGALYSIFAKVLLTDGISNLRGVSVDFNAQGGGSSSAGDPFTANENPALWLAVTIMGVEPANNRCELTLERVAPNGEQLTAGSFNMQFMLNDFTTIDTTMNLAKLHADGNHVADWTTLYKTQPSDTQVVIPAGKSVLHVTLSGLPSIAGPGLASVQVNFGDTVTGSDAFGSYSADFDGYLVTPDTPVGHDRNVVYGFHLLPLAPDTQTLVLDMSAATIISHASSDERLVQNHRIFYAEVGYNPFAPFIGYAVTRAKVIFAYAYGSTPVASAPSSIFCGLQCPYEGASTTLGFPMRPIQTPISDTTTAMDYRVVDGFGFFVEPNLFPRSVPEINLPLLVTEDYEIRQRNRAAFKVYFDPDTIPSDFAGTVQLNAFVSQGAPSGEARQWTPCPLKRLDSPATTPSANNAIIISTLTGLPTAFSDGMLFSALECLGPWNYIKFIVLPIAEQPPINGIMMKIAANAREF